MIKVLFCFNGKDDFKNDFLGKKDKTLNFINVKHAVKIVVYDVFKAVLTVLPDEVNIELCLKNI